MVHRPRLLAALLASSSLAASMTALADAAPQVATPTEAAELHTGPVSAESAGAPTRPVRNLRALVMRAEQRWPGLTAARHRIEAAEARLTEAWVTPFFQINATGTFSVAPEARGTPVFSPDSQLPLSNAWAPLAGVRVEAAIPLYTFGKLEAARDAARAGIAAAEGDEARVRQQLRFDVRRAYFALGLSLDAQQMFSEGKPKLDNAVSRLEERIEAGDPEANEMDRWRLASVLAEVDARTSEIERMGNTSIEALYALSAERDFDVPDCPLAPVAFELETLAHYQALARTERPEAAQLSAAVAAREAARNAARAQYFPDLALGLNAGITYAPGITDQNNPFVQDAANSPSLGWALIARWSLDFWGTTLRTQRAESELGDTRERVNELQSGLDIEVASVFEELRDARRREVAWGRGHRETRAWFVAAAANYQIGAIEPRDLVDAVRAYFSARFSHMQAIHDVNVATAKLERSVGREILPLDDWEQSCGD